VSITVDDAERGVVAQAVAVRLLVMLRE